MELLSAQPLTQPRFLLAAITEANLSSIGSGVGTAFTGCNLISTTFEMSPWRTHTERNEGNRESEEREG